MRFIGITGGVGAGKSEILGYLKEQRGIRVMLADEIAHALMEPGTPVYSGICREFAVEDLFFGEGDGKGRPFDRGKLARMIFSDSEKRARLNAVVHPAVREYVREQAALLRGQSGVTHLFFEAALLIEENYGAICDELWYIYTSEEVRRGRLKASRGYTDDRIDQIFASQLQESEYRRACKTVIDNDGAWEQTREQLESALRRVSDE